MTDDPWTPTRFTTLLERASETQTGIRVADPDVLGPRSIVLVPSTGEILLVTNADPAPEDFDSELTGGEKVVVRSVGSTKAYAIEANADLLKIGVADDG